MSPSEGGSGSRGGAWSFKKLDAYPKVDAEFFTKTVAGGIITILSVAAMVFLFIAEIRLFFQINQLHQLEVDTSTGETITINIDITFPSMPCSWLSLDAMDVSGELHLDVEDHDIKQQRLNSQGVPLSDAEKHNIHENKKLNFPPALNNSCKSCFGAERYKGQCCNTCDELRQAYRLRGWALGNTNEMEQCAEDVYLMSVREQAGEGCKMWGHMEVNKVAGNFHFAPGKSYQQFGMHIHDLAPFGNATLDFQHTIHTLSFGALYPGMANPLDGLQVVKPTHLDGTKATGIYQYFLKVVPTVYTPLRISSRNSNSSSSNSNSHKGGESKPRFPLYTNQFSVTENFKETIDSPGGLGGKQLPGLFFFYDLSPIKVKISETKASFLHFVTNVCAIIGGMFAVSGIIDGFVYQGERLLRKKMDVGKLG